MEQISKSPIMVYFFLLLTVFVLYFFTKDIYFDMKVKNENIKMISNEITEKNKEYQKLYSLKQKIDSQDIGDINFDSFLKPFNEADFLVYFHNYIEKNSKKMLIQSINLTDGVKNDFGFNEGNLNITMKFLDEDSMMNFLRFVVYNKDYNFYMDDFNFPLGKELKNFTTTFNIKVLYK